jgi:hypothetical protein
VSRAEEEDTMVTAIGCKIGLPPVSAPTPPPKSEVHTKVIGGVTVEVRSFPLTLTFSHKGESVVFEGDDVGKVLAWAKEEGFKL